MPDVLVLCYHAVSSTWPAELSVSPAALREQLTRLTRRGYRGTTFSQAVLDPPGEKLLCVTFDDAFASVATRALPILDGLGLPGTVFAPSGYIGSRDPMSWDGIDRWLDTPYRDELLPMKWEQLADLQARGWEIGSHTLTHRRLSRLGDQDLEHELVASKRELETHLGPGSGSRTLAYPFGDHDDRVVDAARQAGYAAACTLPTRFVTPTNLTWPRLGIYHDDGQVIFALKVSPLVRSLRRTSGWNAAHSAFRALR
jgi:peptidoglycan/xylan/chitin deacetylase (PgdA/CDA1 family)